MTVLDTKVQELLSKILEVQQQLSDPTIINDQKRYRELTQRYAYLEKLEGLYKSYRTTIEQINDGKAMLKELSPEDPLSQEMQKEIQDLQTSLDLKRERLQEALIPPQAEDNANTVLELRAGTGGDEAAIFVGDCVRMYSLFSDQMGWKCETLAATSSDMGGYKEYIMVVSGPQAFKILQYEAGTHRVQRVPATESQGRVHTSAITVAVMPEPSEDEEVKIDEKEIRIDTMRSSGAGGQHVNTTDSAVRITHLPTNIVVYCQQERSQLKNREKAMRLLQAKLNEAERLKKQQEQTQLRAAQVGSGDRSERIRTYNFPQNRITDHRIDLTLYSLDAVMNGELRQLTSRLVLHFRQKQLENVQ